MTGSAVMIVLRLMCERRWLPYNRVTKWMCGEEINGDQCRARHDHQTAVARKRQSCSAHVGEDT